MIIAIANQKGGVGKTTLTVNLGHRLSAAGHKVVLVDADPQANTTSLVLGQTTDGFCRLLAPINPSSLHDCLLFTNGDWRLALIGGSQQTADLYRMLAAIETKLDVVHRALSPLRERADYVLIDTPPTKTTAWLQLLYAADAVLVPTQLERHSIEGCSFMARACKQLEHDTGIAPQLLGIIPNMARRNCLEHQQRLDELMATFGATVWPPIPLNIAVSEAAGYGEPLWYYDKTCPAAKAIEVITCRILENTK